jgi:hypothetical protein
VLISVYTEPDNEPNSDGAFPREEIAETPWVHRPVIGRPHHFNSIRRSLMMGLVDGEIFMSLTVLFCRRCRR